MELTQEAQRFDWHGKTGSRIVWLGFILAIMTIVYIGCSMMNALVEDSLNRDLERYENTVTTPVPTRINLLERVIDTDLGVACYRAQVDHVWSCVAIN